MTAKPRSSSEKPAEAGTEPEKAAKAEWPNGVGECVVSDGTAHTGRAVNGKVCSAHANRYLADGTPRTGG